MASVRMSRLRVVGVSAVLVAGLGVGAVSPATATLRISAVVSGDQVVPGPGDDDAVGTASPVFQLDSDDPNNGHGCVFYDIVNMDPGTVADVGTGAAGEAGTIVVSIPIEDSEGSGFGCVDGLDPAIVQAFNADPSAYFVQIDNDAFPGGAVRGQVTVGAVTRVSVKEFVCPGNIRTPADLLAAPAGTCTVAARTGDIGDPPPGFTWSPKPTEFDMRVTLQTSAATLTLDQADLDGGGTCGFPKMTCSPGRFYTWQELTTLGPMTVTAVTLPKGYKFGWATVGPIGTGDPAPAGTVDVAHRSVSFDMTNFGATDGVSIAIYDFRGH